MLRADQPDRHAPACQVFFGLGDGIVPVMEDARGQGRAGTGLGEDRAEVLGVTRASGRHHGKCDRVDDGPGHFQVVAVLGPIGVHTCEHDLAGAEPLDLTGPGNRLAPCRHPAAVDVDFPNFLAVALDSLGVDVDDDALAAESAGGLPHQLRIANGRRVNRDLVGPRVQERPDIFETADSATDGERHETDFGGAADDVEQDRAILMAGGDVEKHQLVSAFGVITRGHLYRITGVRQIEKVGPLDHAPVVDVEARDDPLGQHASLRPYANTSAANAGRHNLKPALPAFIEFTTTALYSIKDRATILEAGR